MWNKSDERFAASRRVLASSSLFTSGWEKVGPGLPRDSSVHPFILSQPAAVFRSASGSPAGMLTMMYIVGSLVVGAGDEGSGLLILVDSEGRATRCSSARQFPTSCARRG